MVKYLSAMLNLGVNQQYYKNYDESYERCDGKLRNKELWNKFHSLETEMIITKSGRRMFPSLHVDVSNLEPNTLYCVALEMIPASPNRFKYSSSNGWFPAGNEEAQSHQRLYIHPDSPARGDFWMTQPISFGRVKLTNTITPPVDQLVLCSMHKYQPRIIIARTPNPREVLWAPSTCLMFPETQFVAVTAYQNEKITKLKIDNNPFAKGFRETGQKCKRKRNDKEDLQQIEKDPSLEPLSPLKLEEDRLSNRSSSISPVSSPIICKKSQLKQYSNHNKEYSIEERLHSLTSSASSTDYSKVSSLSYHSYQSYNQTNRSYQYPSFYPFPLMYSSPFWGHNVSSFYNQVTSKSMYHEDKIKVSKDLNNNKKLTDFSIRAITGCK